VRNSLSNTNINTATEIPRIISAEDDEKILQFRAQHVTEVPVRQLGTIRSANYIEDRVRNNPYI